MDRSGLMTATEDPGNDDELIARARDGDADALRRLLDRYRDGAVRVAYGVLRSADDAEDVAQEAFIKVFRSIGSYRGGGRFFTWLYRITVNLCISRRRASGSRETACETIALSEEGTPEESATRRAAVEAVMSRLSPRQRAVLVLREVEELPYAEIAEIMGSPRER